MWKLNKRQYREIARRAHGGEPHASIAKDYHLHRRSIYRIIKHPEAQVAMLNDFSYGEWLLYQAAAEYGVDVEQMDDCMMVVIPPKYDIILEPPVRSKAPDQ